MSFIDRDDIFWSRTYDFYHMDLSGNIIHKKRNTDKFTRYDVFGKVKFFDDDEYLTLLTHDNLLYRIHRDGTIDLLLDNCPQDTICFTISFMCSIDNVKLIEPLICFLMIDGTVNIYYNGMDFGFLEFPNNIIRMDKAEQENGDVHRFLDDKGVVYRIGYDTGNMVFVTRIVLDSVKELGQRCVKYILNYYTEIILTNQGQIMIKGLLDYVGRDDEIDEFSLFPSISDIVDFEIEADKGFMLAKNLADLVYFCGYGYTPDNNPLVITDILVERIARSGDLILSLDGNLYELDVEKSLPFTEQIEQPLSAKLLSGNYTSTKNRFSRTKRAN